MCTDFTAETYIIVLLVYTSIANTVIIDAKLEPTAVIHAFTTA